MNTVTVTGWLQKDAWAAVQPGTHRRIVCFDLMLQAEEAAAEAVPWRCEIEAGPTALRAEPKLLAGAAVIVRAELRGRAFVRDRVTTGFTRYLLVDRVEFSRVPVHGQPVEASA